MFYALPGASQNSSRSYVQNQLDLRTRLAHPLKKNENLLCTGQNQHINLGSSVLWERVQPRPSWTDPPCPAPPSTRRLDLTVAHERRRAPPLLPGLVHLTDPSSWTSNFAVGTAKNDTQRRNKNTAGRTLRQSKFNVCV